ANVGVGVSSNSKGFSVSQSSYAFAVKNDEEHKQVAEMDSKPSLVIDESCMLEYDYSLALKGKVTDFGLLTNLKTVLTKEGFERFNLKYLGGFWVLIEFCTKELLKKFKSHVGVGSWFSSLEYASNSFVIDERVVWVDIEGVPMKIWTNNTLKKLLLNGESYYSRRIERIQVSGWIPDFLDEDEEDEEDDESDEDFEMVPDTIFSPIQEKPKHDNKSNFEEGEIQSEDLFHIYDLLVKKPKNDNKKEESSKATLKYPPGFTLDDVLRTKDVQDVDDVVEEEDKESFCSGQFRRSVGPQIGEWIAHAKKYLVISVYAPQEASEKRMLWSYLNHMIDRWDSESILMGDFNEDIDILIDEKKVDQELLNKRMNVINSIHDLEKLEATEIAQEAKIKWSIKGDENSKFFHGILNKKRNQHAIHGILSEGNWIEDPNSVKKEFFSHFKERFDSPCSSRLMLEGEFSNKLSVDQSIDLESNMTIEEIKRAVWDCGIDKSPRPDGFTFSFYRRYCDIIKKDVADAVSFFFISGNFPKGGNSSFIALISKMQDVKVVKDYRPISLIGSLYKIIAKILANRLVGVLGELVNEVQSAFIVNRQILDSRFILDELIHWCHAKK
nr:RNA-directed DNA polymerase, eukaryota [Tanacetum cinerariifolium]